MATSRGFNTYTAIHIKRREFGTAAGAFTLAVLCLFVAWGRLSGL